MTKSLKACVLHLDEKFFANKLGVNPSSFYIGKAESFGKDLEVTFILDNSVPTKYDVLTGTHNIRRMKITPDGLLQIPIPYGVDVDKIIEKVQSFITELQEDN